MKIIATFALSILMSACSNSAIADGTHKEPFYKLNKIKSIEILRLWQMQHDSESLAADISTGQKAIAKIWYFNQMFSKNYSDEMVPVAFILVGVNSIDSTPTAYQILAKASATLSSANTGPISIPHEDAIFSFMFKENNCSSCEEGLILVVEDEGGFFLETDNFAQ